MNVQSPTTHRGGWLSQLRWNRRVRSRVAFMAILHGVTSDGKMCHTFEEMEARLHELAQIFPPERTLIKVLGHEGRVDYHVPDNLPGEELGGGRRDSPGS